MNVADMTLPEELVALISSGRWPRNDDEARRQNLKCRVSAERIHRIAPDEDSIFFDPPPFSIGESLLDLPDTVSRMFSGAPDSLSPPGDIVFSRAVILGDFGAGSDAPIALDYRDDTGRPSVIRLRWLPEPGGNRWVYAAPSFARFAELLEL